MPSRERSVEIGIGQTLDWTEIYRRLLEDRSDASAWVGLETWVSLWAGKALARFGPQTIEDVVADTCTMVVAGFDKARGAETFAGFVQGHFLNVRQRLLRQGAVPVVPLDGVEVAREAEDEPAPDEIALLRLCLDELPERERQAVTLRYFRQFTAEDIANALDVRAGNARRIVFNGLARLRNCARRVWPHGR